MADLKICVIVGAGPDLGLSLAKTFGEQGFVIVFMSRRPEARKGYVTLLRDEGMQAIAVTADPGDSLSLQRAFDALKSKLGVPEVLIYNATTRGPRNPPSKLQYDQFIEDFRVNVAGGLFCAQQVIPGMRARKSGTIFFTGGGYGFHTEIHFTDLGIGAAAVRFLSGSLAVELKPQGIHVATVVIRGALNKGTRLDPDLIAQVYWRLYLREPGHEGSEISYDDFFDRNVDYFRPKRPL